MRSVLALLCLLSSAAAGALRAQAPAEPDALALAAGRREAGDLRGAVELLEEALPSAPAPERDALTLALAEALRLSGSAAEAAQLLKPLTEGASPLAPVARVTRAHALRESGEFAAAAALLWPEPTPPLPGRVRRDALRLAAVALAEAGRPREAAAAFKALEEVAPSEKAECRYRRGEALLAAGDTAAAGTLLAALWTSETESPWGRRAGLLLRRALPQRALVPPGSEEPLALARTLLKGGRTADAWAVLEVLGSRRLSPPQAEAVARLRVQALYALRWNADLQATAEALHPQGPGSDLARYATSRALWACLRTDDAARAAALGERLLSWTEADTALAADTRYALGTFYYCRGDWAGALAHLDALEALPLKDGAKQAGLYKAAWAARRAGDTPGALARMRRVAASASPSYADPARYFTALWLEESAQPYLAAAEWESLALGPGYWAAAAREALAARGKAPAPRQPKPLPAGGDPPGDPEAALARVLDAAGFPAYAAEAYEPVLRRRPGDPAARLRLSGFLARSGDAWRAYAMAKADYGDPERLDALPQPLSCIFYPRPFRPLLPPLEGTVPEALVYAIVRRESGFDPSVLSPVGAVGLMQLMPETAAKLALPGEVLPGEEDLVDPAVNLRLGVAYLGQLRALLGRDEAVVAAYNAGEERVGQWLKAFGAQGEREFVAMIPYEETRLYAQRVLFDRGRYASQEAPPPEAAPPTR